MGRNATEPHLAKDGITYSGGNPLLEKSGVAFESTPLPRSQDTHQKRGLPALRLLLKTPGNEEVYVSSCGR